MFENLNNGGNEIGKWTKKLTIASIYEFNKDNMQEVLENDIKNYPDNFQKQRMQIWRMNYALIGINIKELG